MDPHAIFVIAVTVVAFALLASERLAIETVALGILVALLAVFIAVPYVQADGARFDPMQMLSGFGHQALVAICALMILGRGLLVTGALEPAARVLARLWVVRPRLAMLILLCACAVGSGFINDTPIVVVMIPILISVAMRIGEPPSRTMMPMNYSVLIGGMGTSIGTSTNLLVVAIAAQLGVREFGMFDFIHVSAIAAVLGIAYLWLLLPRLLPDRQEAIVDSKPQVFEAQLHIKDGSSAIGRTVSELHRESGHQLEVMAVVRGEEIRISRLPRMTLRAGDHLRVRDTIANLKRFEAEFDASLHGLSGDEDEVSKGVEEATERKADDAAEATTLRKDHTGPGQEQGRGDSDSADDDDASERERKRKVPSDHVAEVLLTEESPLCGRTVRQARFSESFGVLVIGLRRPGTDIRAAEQVSDVRLRAGDMLLVQGGAESLQRIRQETGLLILDGTIDMPRSERATAALLIMGAVVSLAALKILPIAASAMAGVLALILTRCIDWRDIGQSLSAKVILIVASSLALGSALTATGGAHEIASGFVVLTSDIPPQVSLSLLMLLVAAVTNFVSNNAAAAVGTPIAVTVAAQLGVAPEPFVLAVLFGANLCYATPMGYQTNLLVMSVAGYRFSDFLRGGLPLLLLMWLAYSFLLPYFFPLTAL